ncbi:MAG: portal protein [Aeromonadaceae bacterium]
MLTHEKMMENYRSASSDTTMRDQCSLDMQRFFIDGEWWSGSSRYSEPFKNRPRPEFNRIWKNINRLIGDINDMELNAIILGNSEDATDDDAVLLQKRWRHDFQSSDGIEASETATMEAIVGGFGALKLVTKYEDEENPRPDEQYACLEIIHSAATSVYFDAGAIRKDKGDSRWGWHVVRVNRERIEDEFDVDSVCSFSNPIYNDTRDIDSNRDVYVAHYYEVIEKTVTEYDLSALVPGLQITSGDGITDSAGASYTRQELKEIREEYEQQIGEDAPTTRRKVKYVEYALADGEKFLTKPQRMPFKRVPIIPRYGYYAVIDGQEYYCGEVRKNTDAEMFHNMFGSILAQVAAAPQVSKPEYAPEQIARHANQRARADIDNVPFLLSDPLRGLNDEIAHMGPVAIHQPPQLGTGAAAFGAFLQETIATNGGSGQATLPANTSDAAIQSVNDRQDDAFLPIVKNVLHSCKAACETWIPAAQKLYFTNQRSISVIEGNGEVTRVTTLEMAESQDGSYGPNKNTARGRYVVKVEQGEAYKTSKERQIETNLQMIQMAGSDTEYAQLLAYNTMTLTDGEGGDRMRMIARLREIDAILSMGYPVEMFDFTEDELRFIQYRQQQLQQQAQSQENPAMALAQAEMLKGQAAQVEAQANMMNQQVNVYNAETKRMQVAVDAEKAGADINIKQADLQLKAAGQVMQRMQ